MAAGAAFPCRESFDTIAYDTTGALIEALFTLSEMESHLWEATNILRASPVNRTDWKSYILPLLFFKRICDVWDGEYRTSLESYGEDFADEHRF